MALVVTMLKKTPQKKLTALVATYSIRRDLPEEHGLRLRQIRRATSRIHLRLG
jgi:hypothetical protein